MQNINLFLALLFLILFGLLPVSPAHAIPPPDFLIQIASQLWTFFAIGFVFLTAIFSVMYQFIKAYIITHKKTFWIGSITLIAAVSLLGAYTIDQKYKAAERAKYAAWMESEKEQETETEEQGIERQPSFSDYFEEHKNLPVAVSNQEFENARNGVLSEEYFFLDAREDIEVEIGRIPESIHHRFADLQAGRWQELPFDKQVIVLCWAGGRGEEVAMFLRERGITARYLAEGLNDWAKQGGTFAGEIDFYSYFNERRYRLLFTTKQVKQLLTQGAVLVDSRQKERYERKHIPGAINIPTMYLPSDQLEQNFARISKGARVITICDQETNCFDATLTGIELERRGAVFLGKYNKPWDF